MPDELYEVALHNVPFKQAQALYRFLVDLDDEQPFHGNRGMSWSGLIAGNHSGHRNDRAARTVTLTSMSSVGYTERFRTATPNLETQEAIQLVLDAATGVLQFDESGEPTEPALFAGFELALGAILPSDERPTAELIKEACAK